MGCDLSKPHQPAAVAQEELTVIPSVAKRKHHVDQVVVICPYFKVSPEQFGLWKKHCDNFHKAAMEIDGMLYYGMAFNDSGVYIRQGFRTVAALLEDLGRADGSMTEPLKHSALQRVEVHGTRRQLVKVKSKIGCRCSQFFETHPTMRGIRRPTEFSGQPGSDTLVSCHVSVKVVKVEELRILEAKIKAVHRRARSRPGNESLSISKCLEQGVVTLVAHFDSTEAAVEHLACVVAHLGVEALHTLEMHGPEAEMAKLHALMGKSEAAAGPTASILQETLAAAAARAAEDAREMKACAEVASQVAAAGLSEVAKQARERMAGTVEALQKKAEHMAREVYKQATKAVGSTKDSAKMLADQAYKRAMQAASEVRQAADEAARKSYERAMAASKVVEQALEDANKAAEAAAGSILQELTDACEAARSTETAVAHTVEDAGDAVQAEEQETLEAAKMAAELGWQAFEGAISEAAKESREATMRMWGSLKMIAEQAVEELYAEEREAEAAAEAMIKMASDRARAAAWAVVSTSEHAYWAVYEEALAAGKAVDQAKEAAAKAVEAAVDKAVAVWRRGEQLAVDAMRVAEAMALLPEKALERVWELTTTYIVDTAKAFRQSLYMAEVAVEEEIHEAAEDVAWAVNCVLEEVTEGMQEARAMLLGRIQGWHDALVEAEVSALRTVADAADAKADSVERKQSVCC